MPSSVIHHMTYRPQTRELTIFFRDARGVYRYFDVPMEAWEAFRSSASKGTYLNTTFKSRGYRYAKLVMQDKQRQHKEDDNGEHQAHLLQWPLPEATRGSSAHHPQRDDLDRLPRGHEAAAASLRRSVSS